MSKVREWGKERWDDKQLKGRPLYDLSDLPFCHISKNLSGRCDLIMEKQQEFKKKRSVSECRGKK